MELKNEVFRFRIIGKVDVMEKWKVNVRRALERKAYMLKASNHPKNLDASLKSTCRQPRQNKSRENIFAKGRHSNTGACQSYNLTG